MVASFPENQENQVETALLFMILLQKLYFTTLAVFYWSHTTTLIEHDRIKQEYEYWLPPRMLCPIPVLQIFRISEKIILHFQILSFCTRPNFKITADELCLYCPLVCKQNQGLSSSQQNMIMVMKYYYLDCSMLYKESDEVSFL